MHGVRARARPHLQKESALARASAGWPITSTRPRRRSGRRGNVSFASNVRGLDDGPPLLDFGLLKGAERLGRLLVRRKNLLPKVGKTFNCSRVSQGVENSPIKLA